MSIFYCGGLFFYWKQSNQIFTSLDLATRFYTSLIMQEKNQCVIESHSVKIALLNSDMLCDYACLIQLKPNPLCLCCARIEEGHPVFPHVCFLFGKRRCCFLSPIPLPPPPLAFLFFSFLM